MTSKLSTRLREIVKALPLKNHMRVLEIGCGTGSAAREIVHLFPDCKVVAIDRSKKAIQQAVKASKAEIDSGRLHFRQVAIEDFELEKNEQPYDIAFAVRVGALDGRHPDLGELALPRIAKALVKNGKLFIDGGDPLNVIHLDKYR